MKPPVIRLGAPLVTRPVRVRDAPRPPRPQGPADAAGMTPRPTVVAAHVGPGPTVVGGRPPVGVDTRRHPLAPSAGVVAGRVGLFPTTRQTRGPIDDARPPIT